ncbi:MAG: UDP-N-acetylmuramoyl-L-alanyl-D-glutamate--2,6-diaminopimelate ligase [Candidatus Marinimicrobia bacterium]|jgi:UDP-N-acetylmuramoyl-L-alanyl-D-glutamate--2,6-diaminopimelate ligase|nr:UDP-N-acetylmuramoyl-L-alanyl-D-glutamate--2,6-diaminopimelate ligase [Candidatus Neomarinimicrobiota bacterium]
MKSTLNHLVKGIIAANGDIPSTPIKNIQLHSGKVKPGDLYIAVHGTTADGHDYIPEALENGASAIITNGRDVGSLPVPQVKVSNPRKAASYVAAEYYGHPSRDLHIIGITGTNGKTSTATIITSILNEAGCKTAQLGTLGVIAKDHDQGKTLTTMDAISLQKLLRELADDDFSHVVMEVSSHAIHQYRVADVAFDTTVFTNLTPEHLDYHGTMEDYYHAKAKLFKSLPLSATAIINTDDEYGQRLINESTAPVIKVSETNNSDVHFKHVHSSLSGIAGTISAGEHHIDFDSQLIGDFNKENILSAVGAALAMGIPIGTIADGINACRVVTGRMESITAPNGAPIVVDYAHTPDAYEKVLNTIYHLVPENGRLITVFGCGGNRDAANRPIMGRLVEQYSDYFYITPDNPRYEKQDDIVEEIITGLSTDHYEVFADRGDALEKALNELQGKDVLVVLGKGRETYQEIEGVRQPYSDIAIIEEFCAHNAT